MILYKKLARMSSISSLTGFLPLILMVITEEIVYIIWFMLQIFIALSLGLISEYIKFKNKTC